MSYLSRLSKRDPQLARIVSKLFFYLVVGEGPKPLLPEHRDLFVKYVYDLKRRSAREDINAVKQALTNVLRGLSKTVGIGGVAAGAELLQEFIVFTYPQTIVAFCKAYPEPE